MPTWADGTEAIDNWSDLIDSREVIARIGYLQSANDCEVCSERVDLTDVGWVHEHGDRDCGTGDGSTAMPTFVMDDAETEELATLVALRDEASDYAPDWEYGEALIRDSYFVTYAQELADDIGAVSADASWPNTCIDWDQAARELQIDYTSVDFAGVTYWIR